MIEDVVVHELRSFGLGACPIREIAGARETSVRSKLPHIWTHFLLRGVD